MSPAAASVSLPDVSVSRADIASVRGRLRTYQARYAPLFGRRELRGHARTYLQGLLSDEPRKSVERMVLRRRGADANGVRTQQLFLRQARWDDAPILAAHLDRGISWTHQAVVPVSREVPGCWETVFGVGSGGNRLLARGSEVRARACERNPVRGGRAAGWRGLGV